jgi:cellulose synthase/poly-beta-1,6-N-acetylglucosamine synthase-like glycosyltransferase
VEILFWVCVIAGLYPYAGYPLVVALLGKVFRRDVRTSKHLPRVTVVISAYNERKHIEATVLNKLSQDYPAELLDVIVASDSSTDGTDEILAALSRDNARLTYLRQEPRRGKTAALNQLVTRAQGEIIVFADANSIYRPDAIRLLIENFADPKVGYVSGRMLYVNPDGSYIGDGCSAYMRYENWLRAQETRVGSVVGVDGGVDSVRKALYRPMRDDQLPDFVLPLTVVEQGYRTVYEPRAVLTEDTLTTQDAEYRMRVRVALRAFWALWDKRVLLDPLRFPLFSWQLWSHKALRYLSFVPLAMACLLGVVLALPGGVLSSSASLYSVLLVLQVLFWIAVWLGARGVNSQGARLAYYFALLNAASAVAFVRFLRGQKQVLWQPRTG